MQQGKKHSPLPPLLTACHAQALITIHPVLPRKQHGSLLLLKVGCGQQYADEGKTLHVGVGGPQSGHIEYVSRMTDLRHLTCDMLQQVPHLMHRRWPLGVQLGWQQEGGAAETVPKKGTQRVTQGQPAAAAAALALLASVLDVGELWEHVAEKRLVLLGAELLQNIVPVAIRQQQWLLQRYTAMTEVLAPCNSW